MLRQETEVVVVAKDVVFANDERGSEVVEKLRGEICG